MTRFLFQSTAIATMLAMGAPQAGLAQLRIPLGDLDAHRAASEAEMPQLAAALAAEVAAGLSPDKLTCAAPTQGQPCPDGTPMVTPGGIAVVMGEDDSILLAPAADQELARAAVQDPPTAADLPPTEGAEAPASPEETAPDAAPDADADEAASDAPEAAPAPEAEGEAAPEAEDETAAPPADKPDAVASPLPPETDALKSDTERPPESEGAGSDATRPTQAPARADADAESTDEGAEDDQAGDRQTEAGAGDDTAETADQPDEADSADDQTAESREAADAPDEDALAESLAAAGADTDAADADDTPPESRDVTPDAAATRAAEGTAPEAAALAEADTDEAPADDEAETVTISEDAARSSAEDFVTSIAQAMREAAPAEAAPEASLEAGKDNRDRDVARALLAGLAGYAVGQMLPDQGQVALNSGDRVVITRQDGSQEVLKDDSVLMFQPGAQVQTQNFDDGSSRIVVQREDGSRVITIRDRDLRVLRRTLVRADGSTVKLIDDTAEVAPVDLSSLPPPARPAQPASLDDEAALRRALEVEAAHSRRFTLGQIRAIAGVRALVAPINIDAITFDTGSAAIRPDQARQLAALGRVIAEQVRSDPAEMFLVEGYTDTVGSEAMNLALSDRRAESLALALTEYFDVPPENLVVQGYGERFLKVPAEGDIRENRRVAVRRITDLLVRD